MSTARPAPVRRPRSRLLQTILKFARLQHDEWIDPHELAQAVHGLVVGAAVMAAASLHGTLLQVIVTVLVTLAVYWAAERYAQILAGGMRDEGPSWAGIRAELRHGWPMLESAYAPLLVLLLVALLSRDVQVGVLAALVFSTALLGLLGYLAARRSNATPRAVWSWTLVTMLFGVVVIALKLFALH
jgi:hypothetical protein